ncbi:unnamed protein product [Polarella glacialis]|uniref:Uncharacterized protein n=1 Tax=Polarella glacialis TaxID=89957 RepID=A0A813JV45_POLGL|nr:unnamed protein product [Polarella glacialis]
MREQSSSAGDCPESGQHLAAWCARQRKVLEERLARRRIATDREAKQLELAETWVAHPTLLSRQLFLASSCQGSSSSSAKVRCSVGAPLSPPAAAGSGLRRLLEQRRRVEEACRTEASMPRAVAKPILSKVPGIGPDELEAWARERRQRLQRSTEQSASPRSDGGLSPGKDANCIIRDLQSLQCPQQAVTSAGLEFVAKVSERRRAQLLKLSSRQQGPVGV